MFSSDRNGTLLVGIALGANLLLAAFLIDLWASGPHRDQDWACAYQEQTDEHICRVAGAGKFMPTTAGKIHPADKPDHPNYYTKQDLDAQRSMAKSTEAIVYWTKISILLGFLGAVAIVWTLVETRNVTAATREVARDQSRAYLHIEKAEIQYLGRLGLQSEGKIFPAFDINFFIKNTGQTPAKWYEFEIVSRVTEGKDDAQVTVSEVVVPPKRWGFVSRDDVQSVGANSFEILHQIKEVCESPQRSLRISGILEYETEFGEVRSAPFSFFRSAEDIQWLTIPSVDDKAELNKRGKPLAMYRTRQDQGKNGG